MRSHIVPTERPSIARQFRWRLIFITCVLLLTVLLRLLANIYTTTALSNITTQSMALHDAVNLLLSSMVNQETGLRGYSATANPIFLEPFKQGRTQYLSITLTLNPLLHHNEFSNALPAFYVTQSKANLWYNTFALPQLQQIRPNHLPSRLDHALQGKLLFDQFRASLTALHQHISSDVTTQLNQQHIINWITLIAATALSLCTLALLWHIFTLFQRDLTTQLTTLKQAAQQFSAGDHQVRVHPLKHEEFQLVGQTLNLLIDTVDQQQMSLEEQVKEVELVNAELRALFNAVNIAILFVSFNGKILTVNSSFSRFFHLSSENVIGRSFDELQTAWRSFFVESPPHWTPPDPANADNGEVFTANLSQIVPIKRELEVQLLPVNSTASLSMGYLYLLRVVTHEHELDQMKRDFVAQVSPTPCLRMDVDPLCSYESPATILAPTSLQLAHSSAHCSHRVVCQSRASHHIKDNRDLQYAHLPPHQLKAIKKADLPAALQ